MTKSRNSKGNNKIKKIIILTTALILAGLLVYFYRTRLDKDENIQGRWQLLASKYIDLYLGSDISNDEYLDFKESGIVDYKLEREVQNASWNISDDEIKITSDIEDLILLYEDKVIEYQGEDYSLYFIREGSKSEKIDQIKSVLVENIGNEQGKKKKKIDEYTDENLEQIYGEWIMFAEEYVDDEQPPLILDDGGEKNRINFHKDGNLEIFRDGNPSQGSWVLNKELKILNAKIDGQDALIFTVDKVIVLIRGQGNSYYSRQGQNSEKKEMIIDSLRQKQEGN